MSGSVPVTQKEKYIEVEAIPLEAMSVKFIR
jgi:hypothetical protein